jgi:hypothetical protein
VKCGARVALGVAGGYFLGRTKKMKLALMLAGMAAGRRAGGPGELLSQGQKLLGRSPELTKLTDEMRGRLIDAGKQAAVAVATRQVEALTDRVTQRASSLGDAVGGGRKPAAESGEPPGESAEAAEDQEPGREPEPTSSQEPAADREPEPVGTSGGDPAEAPAPARRRAASGGNRGRPAGAAATARRTASPATRAAGKATGRATRATRTRRSDDG